MTKITVDKALIEQAIAHLTNLQPKLANGLLNKRQLEFIDPYVDLAVEALRAALAEPEPETVSIQEAWEAAGGNPGVKATKEELLENLRILDQVCDEADSPPPAEVPLLTEEEIVNIALQQSNYKWATKAHDFCEAFARAIEHAVRQKAGLK